jgi:hypothetical protein
VASISRTTSPDQVVATLKPRRESEAAINGDDFGGAGLYVTALVLMGLGPLLSTSVRGLESAT